MFCRVVLAVCSFAGGRVVGAGDVVELVAEWGKVKLNKTVVSFYRIKPNSSHALVRYINSLMLSLTAYSSLIRLV